MKNVRTNMGSFAIVTLIVTTIIPVYAQQYDSESDFQIDWDENVNGGVMIVEYLGTKKEVRIPPSIQNYPVTKIGDEAFSSNKNITKVTIPNSVTGIGDGTFSGCPSLSSITIPNSITSIGKGAFLACTSLTSITIPDSVTSIGEGTFSGCTNLTAIIVDAGNNSYTVENGVLYNKNKTVLYRYPAGKTGVFNIPNSVTSIEFAAFSDCISLTGVTMPDGVTSIGDYAFLECTSLTGVIIPNSVTGIGVGAFSGCTSLTGVTIPNSVTGIGVGAFSGCNSLTGVTFQGTISSDNFSEGTYSYPTFPGDLRDKYLASDGGPGTYRRFVGGLTWRKQ